MKENVYYRLPRPEKNNMTEYTHICKIDSSKLETHGEKLTIPTKFRIYITPGPDLLKEGDLLEFLTNYPSFTLIEDGHGLARYEKIPVKVRKIKLAVGFENKIVIVLNSFRVNYIDHWGNKKELFQTYYIYNVKKLYDEKEGSNFQIKFTFN